MKVTGLKVRTSNHKAEEIGKLWERFYSEGHKDKLGLNEKNIYAVYHNYELDQNGKFDIQYGNYDLLIGGISDIEGYDFVNLEESKYKVFEVNGQTGKEIFATWQEIWNSNLQRNFHTDYELYSFENIAQPKISVHIGTH
ncbi:MAG: GyrI-like domain-containing protein [Candidatus Altimarinota bacterium]